MLTTAEEEILRAELARWQTMAEELQAQVLRLTTELHGAEIEYRELCDEYGEVRSMQVQAELREENLRTALRLLADPMRHDRGWLETHPFYGDTGSPDACDWPWTFAAAVLGEGKPGDTDEHAS